jgi:ribose-phosphate pyrophosphokinase
VKGKVERKQYPDGEYYKRIKDNVRGHSCVILAGLQTDSNFMEVLETAHFLVEADCKKLTIIVPYFGYSTMEKKSKEPGREGEFVKAKYRADILSELPRASYGNRIVMMDLHAEEMTSFFHNVTTAHISNTNLIIQAARDMVGSYDFTFGATDVGRAKHIEHLARIAGVQPAYVYKRRDSGTNTEVTGANCDVKDKNVVIYDDMIRTGGSIVKAAKVYKSLGAKDVFVISSHLVMGEGLFNIETSEVIKNISVMNTTPLANKLSLGVNVYSVAQNIVDFLQ